METLGQKISPILLEIEGTLWEREAEMPHIPHEFTEEGFRAATKIFMACIMDKMWVLQEKENMCMNSRLKMVEYAGKELRKFVHEMTDIDTVKLYK